MASVLTLPITVPPLLPSYSAPSTSTSTLSQPKSRTLLPAGPAHLKHLRLLHHHDSSFDRHDEHHSALQEKEDEERRRLAQLGATDDLGVGDEDESNELLSLDPKEWKKHDYYAVLGLSKLRFKANQDQIKIARTHPFASANYR